MNPPQEGQRGQRCGRFGRHGGFGSFGFGGPRGFGHHGAFGGHHPHHRGPHGQHPFAHPFVQHPFQQTPEQQAEQSTEHPQHPFQHPWAHHGHHQGRFGGADRRNGRCLWRRMEQENAQEGAVEQQQQQPSTDVNASTAAAPAKSRAKFVRDVTIPDRSEQVAGSTIIKTWILENVGETAWQNGTKLIFIRGHREISAEEEFDVPLAGPSESVEVSAVINVPSEPGRYSAFYRLADAERNPFGNRIWVDFVVPESSQTFEHVDAEMAKEEEKQPEPTVASTVPVVEQPKPSAPVAEPSKYEVQLNALASIGFNNRELNLYLLEQNNGNVQSVANWLLEKMR